VNRRERTAPNVTKNADFCWDLRRNQAAHNGLVAGSSPAGPTTQSREWGDFPKTRENAPIGGSRATARSLLRRRLVFAASFGGLVSGVRNSFPGTNPGTRTGTATADTNPESLALSLVSSARKLRRQANKSDGDMPYRRAVVDTNRGAARLSVTIRSFSSSDQRRRRPVSTTSSR
jgi:hypothetical protein